VAQLSTLGVLSSLELYQMEVTIGKLLSLVIAIGYAVLAIAVGGMYGLKCSAGLLCPLAFIWFPEEIGSITGYYKTGYVNVQTPAIIISFIGWFILVGLPIILFCVKRYV
jgi:hypothetical protein